MPESYTKLFNSILTSTIWAQDDETRLVWIALLAMADQHGEVFAAVPGLAHVARVDVESCRRALEYLSGPDPDSRTRDHGGRRIEEIEGGWALLNHPKYREKTSADERREKDRIRKRRQRERERDGRDKT